jgi:hypothetical protein
MLNTVARPEILALAQEVLDRPALATDNRLKGHLHLLLMNGAAAQPSQARAHGADALFLLLADNLLELPASPLSPAQVGELLDLRHSPQDLASRAETILCRLAPHAAYAEMVYFTVRILRLLCGLDPAFITEVYTQLSFSYILSEVCADSGLCFELGILVLFCLEQPDGRALLRLNPYLRPKFFPLLKSPVAQLMGLATENLTHIFSTPEPVLTADDDVPSYLDCFIIAILSFPRELKFGLGELFLSLPPVRALVRSHPHYAELRLLYFLEHPQSPLFGDSSVFDPFDADHLPTTPCPAGHPAAISDHAYDAGGWACDVCEQPGATRRRWRCDTCSFDLCLPCFMNATPSTNEQT